MRLERQNLRPRRNAWLIPFYKELNRAYGLRPDIIDNDQFRIDADGKTLYWTLGLDYYDEGRGPIPGVTNIGLEVRDGWYRCTEIQRSLGLIGYTRKCRSSSAVKAL